MTAFYDEFVVDGDSLARGLADGSMATDTRVRDALRSLARDDGTFAVPGERPALEFPRPDALEDARYAAEASVLVGIDGIIRAEERVERLEGRLGALEQGPIHAVRRLARR